MHKWIYLRDRYPTPGEIVIVMLKSGETVGPTTIRVEEGRPIWFLPEDVNEEDIVRWRPKK